MTDLKWTALFIGLIFSIITTVATAYELTVDNQAVIFSFINKTCNGGKIDAPPKTLPLGSIVFSVQSDAQIGCMLRYNDSKGAILGIWIHQHQIDCSTEGTIFSYDCTFNSRQNILTIQ